jgi:hypothetical protein
VDLFGTFVQDEPFNFCLIGSYVSDSKCEIYHVFDRVCDPRSIIKSYIHVSTVSTMWFQSQL